MELKRVGTGCPVHSQTASPPYSAQDFSPSPPPPLLSPLQPDCYALTSLWIPDKTGNRYFASFEHMVLSLDSELTK